MGTWDWLLRLQHWVWVATKYFLLMGLVLCVLAIVLGLAIGKYFKWQEIREARGKK